MCAWKWCKHALPMVMSILETPQGMLIQVLLLLVGLLNSTPSHPTLSSTTPLECPPLHCSNLAIFDIAKLCENPMKDAQSCAALPLHA